MFVNIFCFIYYISITENVRRIRERELESIIDVNNKNIVNNRL
jgi:hypothetical protein